MSRCNLHKSVSDNRQSWGPSYFPDIAERTNAMANKEQRANREKRKPKKEKPKAAPQVASFSGASNKSGAGKKPA